ncbi:MAG: NAD-dependent epimerase/dehydratase family protein [Actinobacteria bacterium]|nr:NAD-dependent epimerase/dehydratase family protein [Actinomycetota bacterium]
MNTRETTNVLITGGAGFLGSRIAQSYLDSGSVVRVVGRVGRAAAAAGQRPPAGLEFVELDLCDLPRNFDAFEGQSLVVHTAAMMHADTLEERRLQERVNVDATENVVEACRRNGVSRLIHVSTTAAIGISRDPRLPAEENFRFNLEHLDLSYNRTKHQAELLVLEANGPGLATTVVNPGFMLGPHQGGYRGREVIDRVLRRPWVVCTGGGLSLVHVDDVVDGIRRVDDRGRAGQRYILSGENLSFREIARTVCRIAGQRRILISVPDIVRDLNVLYANARFARGSGSGPQLHFHRHYAYPYYSSEKARLELGYQPRAFATIVADALEHIRDPGSSPTPEVAQLSSDQGIEEGTT